MRELGFVGAWWEKDHTENPAPAKWIDDFCAWNDCEGMISYRIFCTGLLIGWTN